MTIRTLADFFARTERRGDCIVWTHSTNGVGYGKFRADKVLYYAHRWVMAQVHGGIPVGMFVLHSCDNPPCVNPAHLRFGTQEDNIQDAVRRGRLVVRNRCRGHRHPKARLSEEQAIGILRRYSAGEAVLQIARGLGVSYQLVYQVARRKTWKHLGAVA